LLRPIASSMSSVKVFLLKCLAKSAAVMIPTSLLSFITGSLRILFLTIFLAASLSGASGSITLRGVDITSEILVFGFLSFAKTLLTKSRSVMIPIGVLSSITIRLPTSFSVIRAAASVTVLFDSIVMTVLVITSLTLGINYHTGI